MNKHSVIVTVTASLALLGAQSLCAATKDIGEEQDSVYRWGRWSVLPPAAGAEETRSEDSDQDELRPGESDENTPSLIALIFPPDSQEEDEESVPIADDEPTEIVIIVDPPGGDDDNGGGGGDDDNGGPEIEVQFCDPGTACGFATLYASDNGNPAAASEGKDGPHSGKPAGLYYFDLSGDGTSYSIKSFAGEEFIKSVLMHAKLHVPGKLHSLGTDGSDSSRIYAKVTLDELNQLLRAHGDWFQNREHGDFVWGISADLNEIEALQAGNVIANYRGQTEGYGANAHMRLNFGRGIWFARLGPGSPFRFHARGELDGPNLRTHVFTPNIVPESSRFEGFVMQGAQHVGAGWDVVNRDGRRYADVVNASRVVPPGAR